MLCTAGNSRKAGAALGCGSLLGGVLLSILSSVIYSLSKSLESLNKRLAVAPLPRNLQCFLLATRQSLEGRAAREVLYSWARPAVPPPRPLLLQDVLCSPRPLSLRRPVPLESALTSLPWLVTSLHRPRPLSGAVPSPFCLGLSSAVFHSHLAGGVPRITQFCVVICLCGSASVIALRPSCFLIPVPQPPLSPSETSSFTREVFFFRGYFTRIQQVNVNMDDLPTPLHKQERAVITVLRLPFLHLGFWEIVLC